MSDAQSATCTRRSNLQYNVLLLVNLTKRTAEESNLEDNEWKTSFPLAGIFTEQTNEWVLYQCPCTSRILERHTLWALRLYPVHTHIQTLSSSKLPIFKIKAFDAHHISVNEKHARSPSLTPSFTPAQHLAWSGFTESTCCFSIQSSTLVFQRDRLGNIKAPALRPAILNIW